MFSQVHHCSKWSDTQSKEYKRHEEVYKCRQDDGKELMEFKNPKVKRISRKTGRFHLMMELKMLSFVNEFS
jgi:hypothetical protein